MKNSFWFALILGLISAMGMPTAWGQTWGQIPDNIEIKVAELDRDGVLNGDFNPPNPDEVHADNRIEISPDGFEIKIQENSRINYEKDVNHFGYAGYADAFYGIAFTVTVSTNWNNLNLRYSTRSFVSDNPVLMAAFRSGIVSQYGIARAGYRYNDHQIYRRLRSHGDYSSHGEIDTLRATDALARPRAVAGRMPAQPESHLPIRIFDDNEPEPDETFTVVFEEDSDNPQYGWTFTVTIIDEDPERIPNVDLNIPEYVVSTNWGRLVNIPEDPRQILEEKMFPEGRVVSIYVEGVTRNELIMTDSGHRGAMFNSISNILSSGAVPIPVELTVATGRTAVSVDYATQDDTAIAGQDYIETRGTLTFQRGQTLRYLSVPIIDDGLNETNEFFNVVLSNPTNSGLSLRRTVKVQILDDDGPVQIPVITVNDPPLSPIVTSPPSGGASLMLESSSLSLSEGESDTYRVRGTADPIRDMTVNIATAHSGITLNPSRLLFTSDNWQTYKTVTVTASATAADIGEQASIQHSIPFREGFPANNNAGAVSVTLAHTLVEAEAPSPSSSETREIDFQPTAAILLTDYDLAWDDDGSLTVGGQAFPISLTNFTLPIGLREIDFQPTSQVQPIDYDFGSNLALNNDGSLILVAAPSIGLREIEEIGFQPTSQVRSTDYDQDDDGLIEISNLEQLNAVRWDLNGDGQPDKETFAKAYNQAFPSAIDNPQAQGYELAGDLDFGDNPTSWESIGVFSQPFQAVFEGNNHVIVNLFQDQSDSALFYNKPSGLFGAIGNRGQVVNLGMEGVQIKGVNFVGALAGLNQGSIGVCSALGRVEGVHGVGGLVGQNFGDIRLSIAEVEVQGVSGVGDLVGIDTMAR